uniref:DUF3108 domain-containing protein n=1 Tax=Roseihalotalea indica TaxID=2867963 RepID=A0AA49GRJ8_9BACT|nr:hypothetical protein K4G66_11360 [Tunicatimonas sp. TK19036]
MKNTVCALLSLLVYTGVFGQSCDDNFYRMEKGSTFHLTNYDKKDKVTGKQENVVMKVNESGDGLTATIHTKVFDKKDKLLTDGEFEVVCEGDRIKIDMDQMLQSMEQLKSMEGMETEIESDFITLPSDMEIGQELPDSKTTITVKMGGGNSNMMSNDVFIKNRKVAAQEEVTTPAGTFECYKITFETEVNMKVMGMNRTQTFSGANWFARNVGMVKTENYDDKGNLQSYTLLTALK